MSVRIQNTAVQWAAELTGVREVAILGTADLAFWNERLREEHLLPAERGGQAQLLIVAADAKYLGIRFRELSFSILVRWVDDGVARDAAYLSGAFNSSRVFAFCERVFFSTPYQHAMVRVSAALPAAICLLKKGAVLFEAAMGADGSGRVREPSQHGDHGWEGPIFLPTGRRGNGRQGKWFFARLRGDTRTYPFLHPEDTITISPSADGDVLHALRESHFVAQEWVIREDATHAKSKTYPRPAVCPSTARAQAGQPGAAPDRGDRETIGDP